MRKLVVILFFLLSNSVNAVDLSAPFLCKDISPNKIYLSDNELHVGGLTYSMYNENASSTHVVTNLQFLSKDQYTLVEIRQYSRSGDIEVSMIKLSIPYGLITHSNDFSKYKVREVVSFDTSDSSDPKLMGDNQGCQNI
ncbi:hypothetical protein [Aeromonas caviae]|uniref:hypothetical protein n=1 Tax=Aeromonas caviae TaxID=648 RepID=UPI00191F8E59|nr:hypothetical protein [Aeromonas caviae]MBL0542305.1 hypothetical protein [Aeromonas caviae]